MKSTVRCHSTIPNARASLTALGRPTRGLPVAVHDPPVKSHIHAASDRAGNRSFPPADRLASLLPPKAPSPHRSSVKVKPMRAAC